MLENLTFSVTFPNGKTFKGDHDFDAGTTAITGANERGKSLRLEFARYLLFGAKALRGTGDDYKSFDGALTFAVRGKRYRVERKGGGAKLFDAETGDQIAAQTKPVNQAICSLLGYGLAVFDMANCANQGDIEALGAKKPAERKRMVDNVIGLGILDDLAKWVGEEAAQRRAEVEALERVVVAPVEPATPALYRPSADLEPALQALEAQDRERSELAGWLGHEMAAPTPPGACPVPESQAELEQHEAERQQVEARRLAAERTVASIADAEYTAGQLDVIDAQIVRYDAWKRYKATMDKLPAKPTMTEQQLVEIEEQAARFAAWRAYRAVMEKLPPKATMTEAELRVADQQRTYFLAWEAAQAKFAAHKLACPSCAHEFAPGLTDAEKALVVQPMPPAGKAVDEVATQLARIEAWASAPEPVAEEEAPSLSAAEISAERAKIKAWASAPERVPEEVEPELTRKQVQVHRDILGRQREKAKAKEVLDTSKPLPDRSADLLTVRDHARQIVAYGTAKTKYDSWFNEREVKGLRYIELADVPQQLSDIREATMAARLYEGQREQYQKDLTRFTELSDQIATLKVEIENYSNARRALIELRAEVKTFLVPSINVVASSLLSQMTGGLRSEIVVDEDFNITVDGQGLHTLSGSGKAVANLAVRIALGKVLTNRVFSVFLGDELDASMDADRANYTAEALSNLRSSVSQIIMVSHKQIEADHYIEV